MIITAHDKKEPHSQAIHASSFCSTHTAKTGGGEGRGMGLTKSTWVNCLWIVINYSMLIGRDVVLGRELLVGGAVVGS